MTGRDEQAACGRERYRGDASCPLRLQECCHVQIHSRELY
uniref:Uncharacterized protein n=1 Tax=Klebsiella pneumoniae TaxID=573 RepID=A0A0U2R1I2_KLEPN|nr:hypothetical protein pCT-KPC_172 [Klebsiella pneumoniae]